MLSKAEAEETLTVRYTDWIRFVLDLFYFYYRYTGNYVTGPDWLKQKHINCCYKQQSLLKLLHYFNNNEVV